VLVVVVVVALSSCGTSGRTLRDPAPGATAPPRKGASSSTTAVLGTVAPAGLSITTTAWAPGDPIPAAYTCDGSDVSPPLRLSGAPAGTVELLLVVSDPDAAGFLHWAVAGISPTDAELPEGGVPPGAVQLPNDAGSTGWSGPCPPSGTHTYDFTVYALSAPSGLTEASSAAELTAATEQAVSVAAMTGTYGRP
jgi:Raf kinase inhibitor-like YbhB/YbcL family protein